MVSNVRGSFKKVAGKVVFDEANPPRPWSRPLSTFPPSTPVSRPDTHLKSPDFFDLAKYPP